MDITGQAIDQLLLSKISYPIGEIKQSILEEAEFNSVTLGTWYKLDGRSCVGTAYAILTGNTVIPNMTTNGAFLRQAKPGRTLGSYENDAFQGHHHNYSYDTYYGTTGSGGSTLENTNGPFDGTRGDRVKGAISDGTNGTPRTADETRPKNIAVNFYIKVND